MSAKYRHDSFDPLQDIQKFIWNKSASILSRRMKRKKEQIRKWKVKIKLTEEEEKKEKSKRISRNEF